LLVELFSALGYWQSYLSRYYVYQLGVIITEVNYAEVHEPILIAMNFEAAKFVSAIIL